MWNNRGIYPISLQHPNLLLQIHALTHFHRLLDLTDQFGRYPAVRRDHALELLEGLEGDYQRAYYRGVIYERWGKAQLAEGNPGHIAYGWLVSAMESYEKADALAAPGVVDPILRWNTCVRIINRNPALRPKADEEPMQRGFSDDVPRP